MWRSAIVTLVSLVTCLLASAANAGLTFCNETGEKVDVAIAWYESGDRDWISEGWYSFTPRQCASLVRGNLNNKYYYFYATSADMVWSGGSDRPSAGFCTTPERFFYRGASSSNCHEPKKFLRIDTGDYASYTHRLTETKTSPRDAAIGCRDKITRGKDAFADCWIRSVSTHKQKSILACWDNNRTSSSFALCASKANMGEQEIKMANCSEELRRNRNGRDFLACVGNTQLNAEEAEVFDCAIRSDGVLGSAAMCISKKRFSPEMRHIYSCTERNQGNYSKIASCAMENYMTPEQRRIYSCVMSHPESYAKMAVCAVGPQLTAEQQVFADCAIKTGMQPYAMAVCVGGTLTVNELQKCIDVGVGGNGCFGDNNTLVLHVQNAWKDVTVGPGSSNDLVGADGWTARTGGNVLRDIQIGPGPGNDLVGSEGWLSTTGGNIVNDIENGPGSGNDLVGEDGFVCQTFFGGC